MKVVDVDVDAHQWKVMTKMKIVSDGMKIVTNRQRDMNQHNVGYLMVSLMWRRRVLVTLNGFQLVFVLREGFVCDIFYLGLHEILVNTEVSHYCMLR